MVLGGGSSHPPANQSWPDFDNVNTGDIEIFVNACRECGQAFSINVKDTSSGSHRITVICPHCGVRQKAHID